MLVGVTVASFFGTRAVAQSHEALHRRQAAAGFDPAQRASPAGNTETAVAGLRRAVLKDPENRRYRLALAQALAASHLDEATRVLLALRDTQPEDPDTNLQLARLEGARLGRGRRARMSEPRHDIVDRSLSTITCADRIRRAHLRP